MSRGVFERLVVAGGWTAAAIAVTAAFWGFGHARSLAVRRWRRGRGSARRAGPVEVRTFGSGEPVVLLLHGMAAGGNSFGAAFDRLGDSARVVAPDLLGFGGSMLPSGRVTGEDQLNALDEMLAALGLDDEPLIVVGHSMGGPLALRFAARRSDQVRAVVTLCAALYRDAAEANARIAMMGPFEAMLAADRRAEQLCGWMCRHRVAASWLAVIMRPDLPVAIARSGVKHTWDSYIGALDGLLRAPEWEPALEQLAAVGVPVLLVEGRLDSVPIPGRAAACADAHSSLQYVERANGTHMLPLTDGDWCATLIAELLRADRVAP